MPSLAPSFIPRASTDPICETLALAGAETRGGDRGSRRQRVRILLSNLFLINNGMRKINHRIRSYKGTQAGQTVRKQEVHSCLTHKDSVKYILRGLREVPLPRKPSLGHIGDTSTLSTSGEILRSSSPGLLLPTTFPAYTHPKGS